MSRLDDADYGVSVKTALALKSLVKSAMDIHWDRVAGQPVHGAGCDECEAFRDADPDKMLEELSK